MNITELTSGVHYDLSFGDYLNHPHYGSSDLKEFRHGMPAMVKWNRENRDREETEATRIGKAAHCAILTPGLFDATMAVKPEGMTFQSKANKAIREQWKSEGRTILSHADWERIEQINKAFFAKDAAREAFAVVEDPEVSVLWTCAESGLGCKGRPDWFTEDAVYDLKISIEATKSLDMMTRLIARNGWFNQLAHNRAGLNANGYDIKRGRLVVIAPSPPQQHRVWCMTLSEADCDFLEMENENTRKGIAMCERTGVWPDTPNDFFEVELPMAATWTEHDHDEQEADEEDGEENPLA